MHIRRQLTLFVEDGSGAIEAIRASYNPVQYGLIAAHVTLCREDEITDLKNIIDRITNLKLAKPLEITFDLVIRFDEVKGVMIPANQENVQFEELRKQILGNNIVKKSDAHITLMHPRNSCCTNEIFQEIKTFKLPIKLLFDKIHLIEQRDGGKWKLIKSWDLIKQ